MNDYDREMLKQMLQNQVNIMIWIHGMSAKKPFYEGYFKHNIEKTEELIK